MTARPVLGIICDNREVGGRPAQIVLDRYVRAAMHYGDVAALLIPSLPDLMTAAEVAGRPPTLRESQITPRTGRALNA